MGACMQYFTTISWNSYEQQFSREILHRYFLLASCLLLKSGQITDPSLQIDISAHESDPSAPKIIWWGGKNFTLAGSWAIFSELLIISTSWFLLNRAAPLQSVTDLQFPFTSASMAPRESNECGLTLFLCLLTVSRCGMRSLTQNREVKVVVKLTSGTHTHTFRG